MSGLTAAEREALAGALIEGGRRYQRTRVLVSITDMIAPAVEAILTARLAEQREQIAQAIEGACLGDPLGKRPCNPCRGAARIARGTR